MAKGGRQAGGAEGQADNDEVEIIAVEMAQNPSLAEGGDRAGEASGQAGDDEVEIVAVDKAQNLGKSKKKQEPKLHWVLETLFIVKETGEVVESLVRVKVPIEESLEERRLLGSM